MKNKKPKVIFVCTGNSCRSQMAEGILRDMAGNKFEVFSAGSHPSRVHPMSIAIMDEWGIDLRTHTSDPIDQYIDEGIDYVITVCDHAKQACPVFPGKTTQIHWSVDDPFHGWGENNALLDRYRETRNELKKRIIKFVSSIQKDQS